VRRVSAATTTLLLATTLSAQDNPRRGLPGSIALGPRLLDYPMECVEPRGCRVECYQNGVQVLSRAGIGQQDEIRLVASAGVSDEITPRWIEIRAFNNGDVQTLLLTRDSFCDLKSLVISLKNRP
jgi:hypothetical protein